jgi:hypothetical protein
MKILQDIRRNLVTAGRTVFRFSIFDFWFLGLLLFSRGTASETGRPWMLMSQMEPLLILHVLSPRSYLPRILLLLHFVLRFWCEGRDIGRSFHAMARTSG